MTARLTRLTRSRSEPDLVLVKPVKRVKQSKPVVAKTDESINNIANSSENDRENLLIAVVRPLVMYGASLNLIEERLMELSRHFNVKVTVSRHPGEFNCTLGDYGNQRRKIKVTDSGRRLLRPFGLLEVEDVCTSVTRNAVEMADGVKALENMGKKDPLRRPFRHVVWGTLLSTYICFRLFDGSLNEILCTFGITALLCALQYLCTKVRPMADYLESITTIVASLLVHDSFAHSNVVIAILPGYLHLCSMLKNTSPGGGTSYEGYMRSAFTLVYAASLKAGLPILCDVVLMARLSALVILSQSAFALATKQRRTGVSVRKQNTRKMMENIIVGMASIQITEEKTVEVETTVDQ